MRIEATSCDSQGSHQPERDIFGAQGGVTMIVSTFSLCVPTTGIGDVVAQRSHTGGYGVVLGESG